MRHVESQIQRNCVAWFRAVFPRLKLNLFAVPNGGARKRIEGAIMKSEGVTAGVADLLLLYPAKGFHGLCIEMKTPVGRQQQTQKAWQKAVEAQGYKYIICRSEEEFATVIMWYLR